MLIKCNIIRDGGSIVDLGKGEDIRSYHFKPSDPQKPDADHVADVANAKDVSTLLAVKDGDGECAYEIHSTELVKAKAKGPATPPKPESSALVVKYPEMDRKKLLALVKERTGKGANPATKTVDLVKQLQALDAK